MPTTLNLTLYKKSDIVKSQQLKKTLGEVIAKLIGQWHPFLSKKIKRSP
jgi:hypothetical protein